MTAPAIRVLELLNESLPRVAQNDSLRVGEVFAGNRCRFELATKFEAVLFDLLATKGRQLCFRRGRKCNGQIESSP